MKKMLVICLLLVYGTSQLGMLAWYYGKSLIHAMSADWQSIRLNLENTGADQPAVRLSTAVYRHAAKDGEITLNGVLYDVTKTTFRGETVLVSLEKDQLETFLLSQYGQLAAWIKKHCHSKRSEEYVMNWMMKLYLPDPGQNSSPGELPAFTPVHTCRTGNISWVYIDLPGKPPDQKRIYHS